MPGVSIVCEASGLRDRGGRAEGALDGMLHDERYGKRTLHRERARLIAATAYPDYPLKTYRFGDVTAILEGKLYGRATEAPESRLRRLSEIVAGDAAPSRLKAWVASEDGDFVVYLLDSSSGCIHIVTDLLGRLPLYYHHTPKRFLLSRELGFVARCLPEVTFDRMGIAQQLLVGFPLGNRSLVDDVARVPPASYLRVSGDLSELKITQLHCFDFTQSERASRSIGENARDLAELFVEACCARSDAGGANVVSMSGGFDSRAVAAGLHQADRDFVSVTFLDHVGTAAREVGPAEKVARVLGSPWSLTKLAPPGIGDVLALLRMKSGMNPLAMAFLLPFLRRVGEEWGWSAHFTTGELGTFTMPEAAPPVELTDLADLGRYLVLQGRRLPLELVSRITTLDASDIEAEIRRHVAGYPERNVSDKLTHFVLYERAFNWHSEAEDRNRCFFWTTSPFSDLGFFRSAMSCPAAQKRHYRLYREFLLRLSPAVAAIDHAGYGLPITSPKFAPAAKAASLLAQNPHAVDRIASRTAPYDRDSMVIRLIDKQLHTCPWIGEYLSRPELESIIRDGRNFAGDCVDLLFTVTSTIELLATGRSVLESETH